MLDLSLAHLAAGVGVGLAVAVPIGPMGVLCIQRTLSSGLRAGLTTGLGAATVHIAFGTLAALGLGTALAPAIGAGARNMSFLSAGLLFWFAARNLSRTPVVGMSGAQTEGWLRTYGSALLFGLSNPVTILLFIAALPALTGSHDLEAAPQWVAGIFLGSITWWLCLSTTVALIRTRLSAGAIAMTNKAGGAMLAALGFMTMAHAFGVNLS